VAAAAGSADIVLTERGGAEWERAAIQVAEPARLDLTCAYDTREGEITAGQECTIGWTAFDAGGRKLQASTGVELTISPPEVAAFHHLLSSDSPSEDGDQSLLGPSVICLAAGDATISAAAGQTTSSMTLHVRAK
jgi:hypothetical protein